MTERIRVGIIGASVRNGWARDAHIPALRALPEFEITAVSTSRQDTADETAKHFGIPHAFGDPYTMVQHPDVDLVSICVRVAVRTGVRHMVGLQARGATAFNRVRDLVAEGYVGTVLSCTMIITTKERR
jgi:predicted dehydrogenase